MNISITIKFWWLFSILTRITDFSQDILTPLSIFSFGIFLCVFFFWLLTCHSKKDLNIRLLNDVLFIWWEKFGFLMIALNIHLKDINRNIVKAYFYWLVKGTKPWKKLISLSINLIPIEHHTIFSVLLSVFFLTKSGCPSFPM